MRICGVLWDMQGSCWEDAALIRPVCRLQAYRVGLVAKQSELERKIEEARIRAVE